GAEIDTDNFTHVSSSFAADHPAGPHMAAPSPDPLGFSGEYPPALAIGRYRGHIPALQPVRTQFCAASDSAGGAALGCRDAGRAQQPVSDRIDGFDHLALGA